MIVLAQNGQEKNTNDTNSLLMLSVEIIKMLTNYSPLHIHFFAM